MIGGDHVGVEHVHAIDIDHRGALVARGNVGVDQVPSIR